MRGASRVFFARIRGLFGSHSSENAFDDEAAVHVELLTDRFVNQGMNPVEARRAARLQFGGISQLKDSLRERRSYPIVESLVQDLTLAFRQIRIAPRFTVAAAAILALGIGAVTSIFGVVNAVLLRPLPYPQADRLVWVGEVHKGSTTEELSLTPNFLEWRAQNHVFTSMAAYNVVLRTLLANGEALQLRTLKASAALLPVLGTEPMMGRAFFAGEDQKGQDHVAILSYGLWRRTYGGDRTILGSTINLDDGSYVVVGVLPESFSFPTLQPVDLVTPLGKNEQMELTRSPASTTIVHDVIARLKPGVSVERALAEMDTIESHLGVPAFLRRTRITVKVVPLQDRFTGNLRSALLVMLCAVACVLLLVCANVANLLLGRGESRRREMAVRAALGASRGRITQQLLVESLVLSLLGVGMGLVIVFWSRRLLLALIPQTLPGAMSMPIDWRVLGFALASAFVTTIVFGLGPALGSANISSSISLTADGRSLSGSVHRQTWLSGLASLQTAIAIVLLAGGGLMLQSFWKLRYQDLGFASPRIVVARVNLSHARFPGTAPQIAFLDGVLNKLQNVPGVESAGFGILPPGEGHATNGFGIEGRQWPAQARRPVAGQFSVSPNFFRMMEVPLREGREIQESDTSTTLPVALVNETFAHSLFPGENAIGHRIRFEANEPWRTIVGVVGDVKMGGLANPAEPAIFVPYRQSGFVGGEGAGFVIRTPVGVASLAAEIRKQVAQVDPQQPVIEVETLDHRLDDATARPHLAAVLLGGFGVIGLLLAALGLHSVMFVLVRSRFREIGIRLALGGQPREIVLLILRASLRVMFAGVVAGILCAVALSRLVHSLWWGISATDPLTFAVSTVLLILAGLAASFLPARQASRIDPSEVLRTE
jgi:putative ABC transport system permease protein